MNPNAIVLSPEQYEQMRQSLKAELIQEMESYRVPTTRNVYSTEWILIREGLENLLKSDYNNGCGHWYQNQQGLYAAFRLAFKKDRVTNFRFIEPDRLSSFYTELMHLINKYREGEDLKLSNQKGE
jgi:hypothetical protein